MSFKVTFFLITTLSLASIHVEAMSQEFIFEVSNNTESAMINLQVTENGINWFDFENVNVESGSSASFSWTASPEDACQQFIRGNFQELEWSEPVAINFCTTEKLSITFGKD